MPDSQAGHPLPLWKLGQHGQDFPTFPAVLQEPPQPLSEAHLGFSSSLFTKTNPAVNEELVKLAFITSVHFQ